MTGPDLATGDPFAGPFLPWRYMLAVDEVNYDLAELVAYARRSPGRPVINLASGVNFVDAPRGLVAAALRAACDPLFWHDYDGPAGHVAGRAAVAAFENGRGGGKLGLGVEHVIVTGGASAAVGLAARGLYHRHATTGRAPRAVMPVPTFPLVGASLALAGFQLDEVTSRSAGRWLPTVDELAAARRPDTAVIYVNTFNNPTGERYDEQELRALVDWAGDHGISILHDTVSSDVAATGQIPHLLSIAARAGYPDLVTVGSMSKTRAVPGFRAGWLIGTPDLISQLARANELTAPSSPAVAAPALALDRLATAVADACDESPGVAAADVARQRWCAFRELVDPYAAAAPGSAEVLDQLGRGLAGGPVMEEIRTWRASLRGVLAINARILTDDFADLATEVPRWRGDFNTFVRLPALAGRDYLTTTHLLFREHGLQTLPAPAFGLDEVWWRRRGYYTRLSFALPTDQWVEGLHRLRAAAGALAGGHGPAPRAPKYHAS